VARSLPGKVAVAITEHPARFEGERLTDVVRRVCEQLDDVALTEEEVVYLSGLTARSMSSSRQTRNLVTVTDGVIRSDVEALRLLFERQTAQIRALFAARRRTRQEIAELGGW
jgi:hypothetical protein